MLLPFTKDINVYDPWLSKNKIKSFGFNPVSLNKMFKTCEIIYVLAAVTTKNKNLVNKFIKTHGHIVCQKFLEKIKYGDKRVFIINGKVKGAISRVPSSSSILSNLSQGGKAVKTTLSNKEIADEIGVHPSTVSRILRNKYIDTPKGVMPLKSLLLSSVSKTRDISAIQLMKLIKDIVNSENKPKSDKKIAIELNKRGFSLARRTITKYRKKNNIPSSRYR